MNAARMERTGKKSSSVLITKGRTRYKGCFKATVSCKYSFKAANSCLLQSTAFVTLGIQMHLCNKPKDGVRESFITL